MPKGKLAPCGAPDVGGASSGGIDAPQQDEVLTVEEAAALLRVSRWTVYGEAAALRLPHRRVGRQLRFSRGQLLAWLEKGSR